MSLRTFISAVVVLLALPWCLRAEVRTWTDLQGRTVEAEFVRIQGTTVVLKQAGRTINVPLAQLSAADRQYAESQQQVAEKPEPKPSEPDSKPSHPEPKPSEPSNPFQPEAKPSEPPKSADKTAEKPAANEGATTTSAGEPSSPSKSTTDKDQDESRSRPKTSKKAQSRVWTDQAGNQITATFVRMNGAQAVLQQGSRVRAVPYGQLSEGDRDYIKQFLRDQGEEQAAVALEEQEAMAARIAEARARQQEAAVAASAPEVPTPPAMPSWPSRPDSVNSALEEMRQREEERRAAAAERIRQQQEQWQAEQEERNRRNEELRQQRLAQQEEDAARRAEARQAALDAMASSTPEMSTVTIYTCSNCKKTVPENIGAGEKCPHCGIRFDYVENPDGSRQYAENSGGSSSRRVRIPVKGIAALVTLILGGAAALWRKINGE